MPLPQAGDSLVLKKSGLITNTEKEIARIWADILNTSVEAIARDDNFFEIGGHSLLAIQALGKIDDKYRAKITLLELATLSLSGISAKIEETNATMASDTSTNREIKKSSLWRRIIG